MPALRPYGQRWQLLWRWMLLLLPAPAGPPLHHRAYRPYRTHWANRAFQRHYRRNRRHGCDRPNRADRRHRRGRRYGRYRGYWADRAYGCRRRFSRIFGRRGYHR